MIAGRRSDIGLGGFPEIPLTLARDLARSLKVDIRQGKDPLGERRQERQARARSEKRRFTFEQAFEEYFQSKRQGEFRSEKHANQWRSTIETYAVPVIGSLPVSEIEMSDVLRVLQPIWKTTTETASRLRGRIEAVLTWARVNGYREGENPARWRDNLDQNLPSPAKLKEKKHWPALAVADAPGWFAKLEGSAGTGARALELLALTAARSGEVRLATWKEFDLDARFWIIPGARMKAKREHRVPLSERAVALLRSLPAGGGNDLVFRAVKGGALSDMALTATMRRMQESEVMAGRPGYLDPQTGRPAVPHGLRTTFRIWAAEQGYDRDMAELQLAHDVGSQVERAYRRTDMVERRRAMVSAWAQYISVPA